MSYLLLDNMLDEQLISTLRCGGVAVIKTDTIYGIVASANSQLAVNRIYSIKNRDANKPSIILVSSINDIPDNRNDFIKASNYSNTNIPTSIVIDVHDQPQWLTRGQNSLAYRIPHRSQQLLRLLETVGPLIAPSANRQASQPAVNIGQAIDYFGNLVDAYVDGGDVPVDAPASRLIRVSPAGTVERLR